MPHCSNGHGSWHSLWMQAWVNGHSSSLLQPAIFKINKIYQNLTWYMYSNKHLTFFTNPVGISLIPRSTHTKGSMPGNLTFSIHSTRASGAWVQAFFPNACKVFWTFRICCAFWSWCCGWNIFMQFVYCYYFHKIISNFSIYILIFFDL